MVSVVWLRSRRRFVATPAPATLLLDKSLGLLFTISDFALRAPECLCNAIFLVLNLTKKFRFLILIDNADNALLWTVGTGVGFVCVGSGGEQA